MPGQNRSVLPTLVERGVIFPCRYELGLILYKAWKFICHMTVISRHWLIESENFPAGHDQYIAFISKKENKVVWQSLELSPHWVWEYNSAFLSKSSKDLKNYDRNLHS